MIHIKAQQTLVKFSKTDAGDAPYDKDGKEVKRVTDDM